MFLRERREDAKSFYGLSERALQAVLPVAYDFADSRSGSKNILPMVQHFDRLNARTVNAVAEAENLRDLSDRIIL